MPAKPGTQNAVVAPIANPKGGDVLQARNAVTGGTEPYMTLLNQAIADSQAFIWDVDHIGLSMEVITKHRTRIENFITSVTKAGL